MAIKPALSLEIEPVFRSGLEEKVAAQLSHAGVSNAFEAGWIHYVVPARNAKYLPDFRIDKTNIILEAKGRFGGHKSDAQGAKEREKMILLKEQHPEYDIRFVFQRATNRIYKGSKTTYAKWADDHGFPWADKGTVPAAWIDEMKRQQLKKRK
ncbi:hypothetical protein HU230_0012620 [Bradyrhizobium quebecense]|uniref:Uncharacterized protein n=1 Tax=Bradyrhizobium quebecense TaxID=2748629 RepID=A0A973WR85_9BRAD|nr:hypothetical protein [Bradyrhizobium quebecense]UGA46833.1 hypothetical protein HU230_0012620 [Bradyrhizobium quebecense]